MWKTEQSLFVYFSSNNNAYSSECFTKIMSTINKWRKKKRKKRWTNRNDCIQSPRKYDKDEWMTFDFSDKNVIISKIVTINYFVTKVTCNLKSLHTQKNIRLLHQNNNVSGVYFHCLWKIIQTISAFRPWERLSLWIGSKNLQNIHSVNL